jgi:hypothetical protein
MNQTTSNVNGLTIETELYGLHGNKLNQEHYQIDVLANTYKIAGKLNLTQKPKGLYFVRLILKNKAGKTVDENLYWLTNSPNDTQDLEKLEAAQFRIEVKNENPGHYIANIKNSGEETAFFSRLKVVNKQTGELVLPVFFNDNYFTLFPGEQKQILVDLSDLPVGKQNRNLQLVLEPFNGPSIKKEL